MGLQSELYDFFNEGRPRTKNAGVEDIERPGTGRMQRDFDFDSGYKERVVKKYEITTITDKGVEKSTTLPPFEILQIIKSNPDNKDIKFEDIKVGEKYKYFKKTPGGVEKKGEIILKSKTPKETSVNTDPQKKTRSSDTNVNPEGLKSYYLKSPGAVHEISFNNVTKGVRQKVYTIYRTITDQEYKTLVKDVNSKVSIYIEPSDESNHYKDVYYITIPKYKYGTRSGADYTYFMWVKEDVVKGLTEEQKDKLKIVLVPIKDISEGIDKRPLDLYTLMTFLSDKEKEKIKKTRSTKISNDDIEEPLDVDLSFLSDEEPDTEEPSDEEIPEPEVPKTVGAGDKFSKEDKSAASGFVLDNDRILDKIKSNYSRQAKKDTEDAIRVLIDKLYSSLEKKSERDAAIEYIIKNRLEKDNKGDLYNMIKAEYDGTSKSTIEPKSEPEKQTSKREPSAKPKDAKSTDKSSDYKERASKFMVDPKNVSTLNKLIQAFSESEDKEKNDKIEREYQRNQIFKIMPELLKQIKGFSDSVAVKDYIVNELIRNRIAALTGDDNTELYTMISKTYDKMKAKKETINEEVEIKDDEMYNVSVKYDGGKYTDVRMPGKSLKKLVGSQNLEFNKELPFERSVYDPQKEKKENVKGILKINTPSVSKGPLKLIGRRTPEGDPIYKDPSTKSAEKEKVATKTFTTSVSGQGARSYKAPVNMGIKIVDAKPSDLAYRYYIIDIEGKQIAHGTNDWKEAKEKAVQLGDKFKAVQRAALPALGVKINEALSEEDKNILKNYRVSFIVQDRLDTNKKFNVNDNVKDYKDEKTQFIINLVQAGTLTFDKSGTTVFKNNKNEEFQVVSVPDTLSKIVKRSFEAEQPQSNTDSKLESYIRKRIKEAIKEAEVSQYWGYQGADVKKKRLEEYMKKYEWGFQDSKNPYTHSIGSEKHAIVSKLVHELEAMGENGIAMFNSYAPQGYEINNLTDLDDMADTPLGSQLTQPYNPDSLTARGGRVAEMNGPVSTKGQDADQLDRLVANISPKLKDAIIAKGSAENAKELIGLFRKAKDIAADNKDPNDEKNVTDDMIYNKIKSA
jgi:hypothetical protein